MYLIFMKSYIVNCIFVMWNYFSYVCIIQILLTVLTYGDGDYKYMYLLPNPIKN